MRAARRRSAPLAVALAGGLVLAGCSGSDDSSSPAGSPPSGATTRAVAGPSSSRSSSPLPFGTVAQPGVAGTSVSAPPVAGRPVRVRIPAIGVDSRLERLGLLRDGSLAAPKSYPTAGWYDGGVVPGEIGPAIIAGHVDSVSGPAVFFRLDKLRAGDTVLVTDTAGNVHTFVVDGAQQYTKSRFPTSTVYAATPDPQLRLITCTGAFDEAERSYVDNLVVSAHLRG